ncbi:unnamed protein product [Phytomonas sp. EM1]|nr:unnamed protein product [Phytomonas sp. EM1]|eukprot:CCW60413.1 unnamed protein product [Phytomonas sp. isolate EM1]
MQIMDIPLGLDVYLPLKDLIMLNCYSLVKTFFQKNVVV